jgi:hypothetical protein
MLIVLNDCYHVCLERRNEREIGSNLFLNDFGG